MLELPAGYEAQVRPRSGLALRNGVTVLNSPGTIDSDYRGEVGVVLINLGTTKFKIERGARIAQLVVQKVEQAALVEVTSTAATHRGAGGFGSTGVVAVRGKAPSPQKSAKAAKNSVRTKIGQAAKANGAPKAAKPGSRDKRAAASGSLALPNRQNQRRLAAHRKHGAGAAPVRTRVSPRSP